MSGGYCGRTALFKVDSSSWIKISQNQIEEVVVQINCNLLQVYSGLYRFGLWYNRATFDITNAVKDNEEALVVIRIEDDKACTKPRGKQRWLDYDYGCWYIETSGLWKTVWAENVHSTYLNRVKMTPVEDKYHLAFEYEMENFKKGYNFNVV